jgi:5-methylcytosine-specific restriction endonuclease McrA
VPQSAQESRYIPAAVRRSVWQRDEARCTYLDARGQRCREQSGLEFHHQHPHARRGPASVDNLTLRCRSHNDLAAEQDFGRDVIRKKRRAARAKPIRAGAAP